MPEEQLGRALDVAEKIAAAIGRTVIEVLADYDPDPRVGSVEHNTQAETFADLDEQERYLAVRITHALTARAAEALEHDPSLTTTLWAVAHDRAIIETCATRASVERMAGATPTRSSRNV